MNLLESRNRINYLLSVFVTEVKGATAMGQIDINKVSETLLIPLLAEIFGYKNLRNLNATERANYPAIDLGDEVAKVAVQITATSSSNKVKDTLQKFAKYELYRRYDRLIIYVLTERQKSYSEDTYKQIIQGKFDFDPSRDILDYRDLLQKIESFQTDIMYRIENLLESNFGEGKTPLFLQVDEQPTEEVHLNLLELSFPQTLYVANLTGDKKQSPPMNSYTTRQYRRLSGRERVQKALDQHGLKFGVDWKDYSGKIVTFHDLREDDLPLGQIVKRDTVTLLSPNEFYGRDENYERTFKALLGRCLQQMLYRLRVLWQYQDKLFIFSDVDGKAIPRIEQWYSKHENKRTVYERVMKKTKPDEILHYKHLAFKTQYKRFGGKWYLLIKPEWFFSHDGYKRSYFAAEKIDWMKRQENNEQVYNHLRFIAYFLTQDKPPGFFVQWRPYPFLSFGELLSLDSAPALNDNDWKPSPTSEEENSEQMFILDL